MEEGMEVWKDDEDARMKDGKRGEGKERWEDGEVGG